MIANVIYWLTYVPFAAIMITLSLTGNILIFLAIMIAKVLNLEYLYLILITRQQILHENVMGVVERYKLFLQSLNTNEQA